MYKVIRKAISEELAQFVYEYFLMKRKVARKFYDDRYISPFNYDWGVWNDEFVPETYSHYCDIAMDTLLKKLKPLMEDETGLKLYETYSSDALSLRSSIGNMQTFKSNKSQTLTFSKSKSMSPNMSARSGLVD